MTQIPQRRFSPEGLTLSPAMEDYLKAIFSLGRKGDAVSTQALADRLKFSPASVTKMVKRLAEYKLVKHEKYQGVHLTESGRKVAVEIVRHHRLLELYLTQALGFSWDEVHEEAELLEHFISEKLEAKICEYLGNPDFDPHGAPIPTLDGVLPGQSDLRLSESELYQTLAVTRVSDAHSQTLQELEKFGVFPGITVTVLGRPPEGSVFLKVGRQENLVPPSLCEGVFCKAAKQECFVVTQLAEKEQAEIVKIRSRHRESAEALGLKVGTLICGQEGGLSLDKTSLQLEPELAQSLIVRSFQEPK